MNNTTIKWCDLVLEGGGAKIPALVGAIRELERHKFMPLRWAGSSSGAIVSAFGAAGYSGEEMAELILDFDFNIITDGSRFFRIWHLIRDFGIHPGIEIYKYMEEMLDKKGVSTFGDLKIDGKYILAVTATDISNQKLVTFPFDASDYGINPDKLSVATAVRASMAIPGYFTPVDLRGSLFVDGGMLSNFPLWIWDSTKPPRWPTFGLLLDEQEVSHEVESFRDFFIALIKTFLRAHDKRYLFRDDYKFRTIRLPTLGVSTTDFSISINKKLDLIHAAEKATRNFLKQWSWSEYKMWYQELRRIRISHER